MSALTDLAAGWARYKQGILWHNPAASRKCSGFADANPGEAAKLDAYVAAVAAGTPAVMPQLATATGDGLARLVAAFASLIPKPFTVTVHGLAQEQQTLKAVIA